MFYNFITNYTHVFVEKNVRSFCTIFCCFQQKYWYISDINVRNFSETVTNEVVSFEQPGPEFYFLFIQSERNREWASVIPNSQLVIIPNPPDSPSR